MKISSIHEKSVVTEHCHLKKNFLLRLVTVSLCFYLLVGYIFPAVGLSITSINQQSSNWLTWDWQSLINEMLSFDSIILICIMIAGVAYLLWSSKHFFSGYFLLKRYSKEQSNLTEVTSKNKSNLSILESTLNSVLVKKQKSTHPLLSSLFESYIPVLFNLIKENQTTALQKEYDESCFEAMQVLRSKIKKHPLNQAKHKIDQAIEVLLKQKVVLKKQWETQYKNMSWWQKLSIDDPSYVVINGKISKAKKLQSDFNEKYSDEVSAVTIKYISAKKVCIERLKDAHTKSKAMIERRFSNFNFDSNASFCAKKELQFGMWGGIFGLSVSVSSDLKDAGDIYDALRSVNGNFSEMINSEIWWECLWLDADKLAGLTSLTKGAYFEQLVANDTGGELFEHFNHKDTDIIIDGVEVQLKATDSVSYINSVDSDIQVIATTEVANKTSAIDSGISNTEITESTTDALGGTVIDGGDAIVNTVIGGLGGLGLFASIRGFNHTMDRIDKKIDTEEAILEGAEIAVVGTAKGLVDTAELIFKLFTSKPLKFIGKLLWGTVKFITSIFLWFMPSKRN